ncbi:MAG TPA: Ni/Fe-hydrogenase cytochrome b subunit [Anaeromyxobacteraceae bacterium]|nr:Ni/Fe-hydrogenase cytochrome b subunit [Anaeromyxobacteraceae bacterium]
MSAHSHARPLGGRILTPFLVVLLGLAAIAGALVVYRLFAGVGSITALTDHYSWGIWKPINVVTFTGIGAGAYAVGLLTYILNQGKYHPLVRPAVLVGAIGYSLGGASVMIDLGRWWGSVFLFFPPWYNFNSILLEVALCVLTYVGVLWVEVTPALLEQWGEAGSPRLKRIAAAVQPKLRVALPFIIALAMLLPTMHQSSLGSLYLMAPTKVHPLWFTGWLPGLFLISCLSMGFGSVTAVDIVAGAALPGRYRTQMHLLGDLGRVAGWVNLAYVALRLGDLAWTGRLRHAFAFSPQVACFWVEILLFGGSGLMFLSKRVRADRGRLFTAAILALLAGAMYRVDTYLVAYDGGPGARYFPSIGEILVTLGLAALGVAAYLFIAKKLPIFDTGENHP